MIFIGFIQNRGLTLFHVLQEGLSAFHCIRTTVRNEIKRAYKDKLELIFPKVTGNRADYYYGFAEKSNYHYSLVFKWHSMPLSNNITQVHKTSQNQRTFSFHS